VLSTCPDQEPGDGVASVSAPVLAVAATFGQVMPQGHLDLGTPGDQTPQKHPTVPQGAWASPPLPILWKVEDYA
jgi:hypothetical protein